MKRENLKWKENAESLFVSGLFTPVGMRTVPDSKLLRCNTTIYSMVYSVLTPVSPAVLLIYFVVTAVLRVNVNYAADFK